MFLVSQGTPQRGKVYAVFSYWKIQKEKGEKLQSAENSSLLQNKDMLMQIGIPMSRLVGFTHLPFTSVWYWISSKAQSHIRGRHIHLCTSTLLYVCRNASQIYTPALAAWQVNARAPCIWHLCQRLLLRKQESSENVPLDLENRPLGGHTYGLLRTCRSHEMCSWQESLCDPRSPWSSSEMLPGYRRNTLSCHSSIAKKTSLPHNYLLGKRHIGDSDNIHVGAGTRWQHRTCPTVVKNLHFFWLCMSSPKHVLFLPQAYNKAFRVFCIYWNKLLFRHYIRTTDLASPSRYRKSSCASYPVVELPSPRETAIPHLYVQHIHFY